MSVIPSNLIGTLTERAGISLYNYYLNIFICIETVLQKYYPLSGEFWTYRESSIEL